MKTTTLTSVLALSLAVTLATGAAATEEQRGRHGDDQDEFLLATPRLFFPCNIFLVCHRSIPSIGACALKNLSYALFCNPYARRGAIFLPLMINILEEEIRVASAV